MCPDFQLSYFHLSFSGSDSGRRLLIPIFNKTQHPSHLPPSALCKYINTSIIIQHAQKQELSIYRSAWLQFIFEQLEKREKSQAEDKPALNLHTDDRDTGRSFILEDEPPGSRLENSCQFVRQGVALMMSSRAVPILIMVVGARGTYLHPAASFLGKQPQNNGLQSRRTSPEK